MITTVRPLAEKRSEGLIGLEVSMVALRGERACGVGWKDGRMATEYKSTLEDYLLVFGGKVEEKA